MADFTAKSILNNSQSNYKNSQVVDWDRGDLAEFGKTAAQIMIDFPPPLYMGGK